MKQKKRWMLYLTAAIVLSALWFWRYKAVNRKFDAISDISTVYYPYDTVVEFGDDYLNYRELSKGYTIQVEDFRFLEYADFCWEYGFVEEEQPYYPDKMILLTVEICNVSSQEDGVAISNLLVHGVDFNLHMELGYLEFLNPFLKGYTGIRLEQGGKCRLVLPYPLYQGRFSASSWKKVETLPLYFMVTSYPTEKTIILQGA